MTTPTIADLLKYVNLQMASEAFLVNLDGTKKTDILQALKEGNDRASLFPDKLAQEFTSQWEVVDQRANTGTGFSGTLFKAIKDDAALGIHKDDLVISLRSTEFIDDAARDNQATNVMEIKQFGWAFGQIDDLRNWFKELDASPDLLQGKHFSLTGYSLGAHLATAFHQLHLADGRIDGTYTFNGAGVGELNKRASLEDIIARFDQQRATTDGSQFASVFTNKKAWKTYLELRTKLAGGVAPTDSDIQLVRDRMIDTFPMNKAQGELLIEAMTRVKDVMYEVNRLNDIHSGAAGSGDPQPVSGMAIDATKLDYQLAVLAAQRSTSNYGTLGATVDGIINTIFDIRNAIYSPINNFYDIFGSTYPSAVASSQQHYGKYVQIAMEDQPAFRGDVKWDAAKATWEAWGIKLLVNGFSQNDFGDTHSLVLLVDSLNVQNTLAQLDPKLDPAKLQKIFKIASNLKGQSVSGAQGLAEGDALENLVNALADTLNLGWKGDARLKGNPNGNTWFEVNDKDGYSGRNTFYTKLKAITDSAAYKSLIGKVTIEPAVLDGTVAKKDFGAFLSLYNLTPFTMKGGDVESALGGVWGSVYTDWAAEKDASGAARENFSDQWLKDRAKFLSWIITRNTENCPDGTPIIGVPTAYNQQFTDFASGISIRVQSAIDSPYTKYISFGADDADDYLLGYTKEDRLYGGGGNDTLDGKEEDDYLEGNAGNDSLLGGAGNDVILGGTGSDTLIGGTGNDVLRGGKGADTYQFATGDGIDTIIDADGANRIIINGATLTLAKGDLVAGKTYTDTSNSLIKYTLMDRGGGIKDLFITYGANDSILIKNYTGGTTSAGGASAMASADGDSSSGGDYGLTLQNADPLTFTTPPAFPGAFRLERNYDSESRIASFGYMVDSAGVSIDASANVADTSSPAYQGITNFFNAQLHGGNDVLIGGAGNDFFMGAWAGSDVMIGNGGEDIIYVDGPTARAYAEVETSSIDNASHSGAASGQLGAFIWTHQASTVVGGAGDDMIASNRGGSLIQLGAGENTYIGGITGGGTIGGTGNPWVVWSTRPNGSAGFELNADWRTSDSAWLWDGTRYVLTYTGSLTYDPAGFFDGYFDRTSNMPFGTGSDTILGGSGNNHIILSNGGNYVDIGKGHSTVFGGFGDDTIYGGSEGGDEIVSSGGNDLIVLQAGNNKAAGGTGNNTIIGGGGNDILFAAHGDYYGLEGMPWYDSNPDGGSYVEAGSGNTVIYGSGGTDQLVGGSGNDSIYAGNGDEYLDGAGGNDLILGRDKDDDLFGGAGNDSLEGGKGNDYLDGEEHNDFLLGEAGEDELFGGSGNDSLAGGDDNDYLDGEAGQDILMAGSGDDTMVGGSGNDGLSGEDGSDYLEGNSGNDYLAGGAGDDTYAFSLGDGYDYVSDTSGATVIDFAGGIHPQDLQIHMQPNGAVIFYGDTDAFFIDTPVSASYRFADGTRYTLMQLRELANTDDLILGQATPETLTGGRGRDELQGGDGNDYLLGGEDDDVIFGQGGHDTLDGGAGDDLLSGDWGRSTYLFGRGGGQDTINNYDTSGWIDTLQFAPDIKPEDIEVSRSGNDLVYTIKDTGDSITVQNHYLATRVVSGVTQYDYRIAKVELGDGTLWTAADTPQTYAGSAGADSIEGTLGNDVFRSSSGDDTLNGGGGADTFEFGATAGRDTVYAAVGSVSTIRMDAGLAPSNITVTREAATQRLVIGIQDAPDTLTVEGGIDVSNMQLAFADGTVWSPETLIAKLKQGSEQDDSLWGTRGNDAIDGLGGNDTIVGANGNDTIHGGSGNDTIICLAGDNVLDGGDGDDRISSGSGHDQLAGGSGADSIDGYYGDDSIAGNAGNDTLIGGYGNDTLDGGAGNDVLQGDQYDTYLFDIDGGFDTIINSGSSAYAATNAVMLGAGFAPATTVAFKMGNDLVIRSEDGAAQLTIKDHYLVDYASSFAGAVGKILFADGAVWDQAYLLTLPFGPGSNSADFINGSTAADSIAGYAGNDTIVGLAGNDTLDGGAGNDSLAGGADNDTYVVDSSADIVAENAGEGIDLVQSTADFTLPDNLENLTLISNAKINGTGNALDNIIIGGGDANLLIGGAGNDTLQGAGYGTWDTVIGGTGDDTYNLSTYGLQVVVENPDEGIDTVISGSIYTLGANLENLVLAGAVTDGTGNELDNRIVGNAAANTIKGMAGNDTLDGGAGNDSLVGGIGNDTYVIDTTADAIAENAGEGSDTVQSFVTYTLGANLENLTLTGTAAVNATGNSGANILTGNAAANAFNSGGGNDTMRGGAGNDTYVLAAADTGVLIEENASEGIDTVQSAGTYTLTASVENLILTGTAAINATGNDLDNALTGNSAANVMKGGKGNDTYVVGSGDTVTELAGEGIDAVQSAITYTLSANVENLTLTGTSKINGAGNDLDNVLIGNSANNVLTGGKGNDTYTITSGDTVTENLGEGTDTVIASFTYTLGSNLENLTLAEGASINGTGNTLANLVVGNSAANTLNGGTGIDTLKGGAGNDTYVVDNSADVVVENANEGIDTVQSTATYILDANVENLTLTGSSNINGTGNTLANIVIGNSGTNLLTGGKGDDLYIVGKGDTVKELFDEGIDTVQSGVTFTLSADVENLTLTGSSAINGIGNGLANIMIGNSGANTLTGKGGDDVYVIGAGDSVVEIAGEGNDTVKTGMTYTLGAYVENLILLDSGNVDGTGNDSGNFLAGNSGNNKLDGRGGADTMQGGAGNDTYVVDSSGDVIIENVDEGIDTVQANMSFVSGGNIENITLLGSGNIDATGDAVDNVLTGNGGINVLTGGAGNDTLNGGGGNDSLIGGTGNDFYIISSTGAAITENAVEGVDTVQSSVTYSLAQNVENLTLTGTGAANGTGNSLNNVIYGNAGVNVLDGGDGADEIHGGDGNDTIIGGDGDMLYGDAGDDLYIISGAKVAPNISWGSIRIIDDYGVNAIQSDSNVLLQIGSYTSYGQINAYRVTLTGTASVVAQGNESANMLTGNAGDNFLTGNGGNDSMYGGDGNDSLDGGNGIDLAEGGADNDWLKGSGNDSLKGGTGDDTYVLYGTGDTIIENLGEGTDLVEWHGGDSYTLVANVESLTLFNPGSGTGLTGTGNGLNNYIAVYSSTQADTLYGMAGDDTLDGSGGADSLIGGTGNDVYVVDNAGDKVAENLNEGTDTVRSTVSYTLGSNVEDLTLIGSGMINGTGNALDNVLAGNSAYNILTGGAGNDTYVIDASDTVVENAGEGTDTVTASFSYTLGANLENLTLTGAAMINGTGNALNNVLTGNGANNTLDGGLGVDTLRGGAGNDTYIVDVSGDVVTENAGEGTDTVLSAATYTLSANLENLTLTGSGVIDGAGNALDNTLAGNSAANRLTGGAGNDTYVVGAGDTVIELLGEGVDTVQASVSWTLDANIENLTLTGSAISGTGNDLNNTLAGNTAANTLTGGRGDDVYIVGSSDTVVENADEGIDSVRGDADLTLGANIENLVLLGVSGFAGTGNNLNNTLTGNNGNNILDGGIGSDTMAGGKGNDIYLVDSVDDVVNEAAGEGADTVRTTVTRSLGANVEHLVLLGTASINGSGNELDNALTGNTGANSLVGADGNDTLDGGGGLDTLVGGAGNDIYLVDGADDVVTEAAVEGVDTVRATVDYVLGANLENLVLIGDAMAGTGNGLDNVLSAADTSADTLIGGLGNDSYVIDSNDTIIENADGGIDTVQIEADYILGDNLENLTLLGTAAASGTGNDLDNVLTGNGGFNILAGRKGNDTYVIGASDSAVEYAGEGIDTVLSSASYTLGDNLENLTLTGAATNAIGNFADNILIGNAANNALDGMQGADTMQGGMGDDTYYADDLDTVAENAGEGVDTIMAEYDYTLGANFENLLLDGINAVTGVGNALNNALQGNFRNNLLAGNAGDDSLDGGIGADTMSGGVGNDTYEVDSADDVVVENADEGFDTVNSRVNYVLGDNLENLTLTSYVAMRGIGNSLNNVITGNGKANLLDGSLGADTLIGGAGDDTYIVDDLGDRVVELASAAGGLDAVLSSVSFTLEAGVENLTLTGTAAINGTGNAGNNILNGNSAANSLVGGEGSDTIDGGAGADIMAGGWGSDTYIVDDAGDMVTEDMTDPVHSIDTVLSSVSFVLEPSVDTSGLDNLTLTGYAAINATGNALGNMLVGNAANNVIDGGVGADVMIGDGGDDIYVVDDAGDWIGEYADQGLDQVRSSISHTLAVNLEALTLTGTAAINGTGNALDNLLLGNSAANALDGAAGNDILQGAAGADSLADNAGNNLFDGGLGDDVVSGGAGNDFIAGGAGNDIIATGTGADIIAFNRGDGQDIVNASTGKDNLVSLGKGIQYADLLFMKSANDLLLVTGTNEQVTFKNWYASPDNHSVARLQVVVESSADYDAASESVINNHKVVTFDFDGLLSRFDAALAVTPALSSWALSAELVNFYLTGSDTEAMGGDLAYQYALNGSLSTVSMTPAQALLNDAGFGSAAQGLQVIGVLQDTSPLLI